MSTNDLPPTGAEGTIAVPEAKQMTENWRTYLDASGQKFNVRSYLIPIISLSNLLKYNPDAEAVRAYIGLTDPTDPTTSQLLLVPIVDGKEVILVPLKNDGGGVGADDGDSNIYDLSTPCPPKCGDGTGTELDG